MERLLVFADFNWLVSPELVGELCYEKLRGSDSYAFKFDENWLKVHAGIKLSEDINNYPGMQYTRPGSDIFGCFSDALPDRWGRTLLKRREQIQASEESYMIKKEDAENIIQEVQAAVSKWENLAILPFSYLRCSD